MTRQFLFVLSLLFVLISQSTKQALGFSTSFLTSKQSQQQSQQNNNVATRIPSQNLAFTNGKIEKQKQWQQQQELHQQQQKKLSSMTSFPFDRATEISRVVFGEFINPIFSSFILEGIPNDWDEFWSTRKQGYNKTNAELLADCFEQLGPVYVKFAQALGSRPDIVGDTLGRALSVLQDDMQPFDTNTAKEIIRSELLAKHSAENDSNNQLRIEDLDSFINSLSTEPVAAASIAQVFSGYIPKYGKVAVKVQRPGIREIVERDAALLRSVATWAESIPAIHLPRNNNNNNNNNDNEEIIIIERPKDRLIAAELVKSVDEFMSRLFEELDFRNEVNNIQKFAQLYAMDHRRAKEATTDVAVIVPKVYTELCTENVIVMEWINGTKLTNVIIENDQATQEAAAALVAENLALVELCIQATLSQLLDTGVLQ